MRISEIELKGERRVLCLNLWALKRIYAHWGDFGTAMAAVSSGNMLEQVGEQLVMLQILLRGGAIYAAEMGMKNPEPPSIEETAKAAGEILDKLSKTITEALNRSMSTDIHTAPAGERDGKPVSNAAEWLLWYGLRVGLSYRETHAVPLGELMDLASVEQVKNEGAKLALTEEEEFFELLKRR